jgi:hypothetical protein
MPIRFERREQIARYLDAATGEERQIAFELSLALRDVVKL